MYVFEFYVEHTDILSVSVRRDPCYEPVRALQRPLANTGTYNPNRQLTPSTSRNLAFVFHERKPHTWVPHVTHTCGASNVARQLVVVARRSAAIALSPNTGACGASLEAIDVVHIRGCTT